MAAKIQAVGNSFANSASARTITFGNNVGSGNLLVLAAAIFNSGITLTVSGSVNGSYTQAGAYAANGSSRAAIFYFFNSGAGSETITVTPSASAYLNLGAIEINGVGSSDPIDGTSTNTGSNTVLTTGSVTITQATELVVAVYSIAGAEKNCEPDGVMSLFWFSDDTNSQIAACSWGIVTANTNAQVTVPTLSAYAAVGASFKVVPPAASPTYDKALIVQPTGAY